MRVGEVVKVILEKKIGFIRSECLREDVYFHFSKVEKTGSWNLQAGDEVEFEIDELRKIENERLQATRVRIPLRPLTKRLEVNDTPNLKAHHHPNARRRRPTWRGNDDDSQAGDSEAPAV